MKPAVLQKEDLLDLGFLVRDMLSCLWVELDNLDLFRSCPLVLRCRIKMTRTRGRFQLDLFPTCLSHNKNLSKKIETRSDLLTASAQIGQNRLNTQLVDHPKTGIGNTQGNPAVFRFDKKAAVMQIRHETASRLVMSVRDRIPGHGFLPCYLANTSHKNLQKNNEAGILPERMMKHKKKQRLAKIYCVTNHVFMTHF